jgi:hypothetical protein
MQALTLLSKSARRLAFLSCGTTTSAESDLADLPPLIALKVLTIKLARPEQFPPFHLVTGRFVEGGGCSIL